jgi:hypothetical protein
MNCVLKARVSTGFYFLAHSLLTRVGVKNVRGVFCISLNIFMAWCSFIATNVLVYGIIKVTLKWRRVKECYIFISFPVV